MRAGTIVMAVALIVGGGSACNPGSTPCEERFTREDCEADPECMPIMGIGIHRQNAGRWAPDPGDCRYIECSPRHVPSPAVLSHASPPEDPAQCYGVTLPVRTSGWGRCADEQRVPFAVSACGH